MLDVKELSRVGFFEAFYTSVCTAGLYFSSRKIAQMSGAHITDDDVILPQAKTPAEPLQAAITIASGNYESYKRARPLPRISGNYRDAYLAEISNKQAVLA